MAIKKLVIKRPQATTVEKRTLILLLPYLGDVSLQTRTKLRKSFKVILSFCKFRFKDRLLFDLVSGVIDKYTCRGCNSSYYGETDRHLKVRSGEHIGISPLTFRKVTHSLTHSLVTIKRECNL